MKETAMKKIVLLLLALLVLTGCSRREYYEDSAPTEAENTYITEFTEQTEPLLIPETTQPETVPTLPQTLPTLPQPPQSDDAFVRILDYIPTASQELMYATEQNFTGQVIYDFADAYLRWGTVQKLMLVSKDLEELGLYLKIWDGFRPVSAQFTLWQVYPDPTYVANPNKGYSSHSRGNTIDLTLVDANGKELEMPTAFDDFSAKADRDYSDCTPEAANNARLLEVLMEKHGFTGYRGEWWHFSDTVSYDVEHVFEP